MCKTGTTPKRPAAMLQNVAAASAMMDSAAVDGNAFSSPSVPFPHCTSTPPNTSFFPQLYNPAFMSTAFGALAQQLAESTPQNMPLQQNFFSSQFSAPTNNLWFDLAQQQRQIQIQQLLQSQTFQAPPQIQQQSSPLLPYMDFLAAAQNRTPGRPSFEQPCFPGNNNFLIPSPTMRAPSAPSTSAVPVTLPQQKQVRRVSKRPLPEVSTDSGSDDSSECNERPSKKEKATKRKHEATLDGERRVAIEFENMGSVGKYPQTYGKGALLVPDGVSGKYSAFGQRWRFNIAHAVGPVICEDGVQRMCLSWSVTNLNSGVTHSVVETPADAMKRDRDGKTLCNRVFRDALSIRASALETELRKTEDASLVIDLQSQLRTIQTKRFSEGPLFFGLRHMSLQNELKREMKLRQAQQQEATQ